MFTLLFYIDGNHPMLKVTLEEWGHGLEYVLSSKRLVTASAKPHGWFPWDPRVFRGKPGRALSSSTVSQAFCLMHTFLPRPLMCCLLWSHRPLLVVCISLDGDRLVSSLCRHIPWRLGYCCSFPYLQWEKLFAGHFERPNRMKLLIT